MGEPEPLDREVPPDYPSPALWELVITFGLATSAAWMPGSLWLLFDAWESADNALRWATAWGMPTVRVSLVDFLLSPRGAVHVFAVLASALLGIGTLGVLAAKRLQSPAPVPWLLLAGAGAAASVAVGSGYLFLHAWPAVWHGGSHAVVRAVVCTVEAVLMVGLPATVLVLCARTFRAWQRAAAEHQTVA